MSELESNAKLWKVNYERLKKNQSKWIVANNEDAPLIKAMFRKFYRSGPDEK